MLAIMSQASALAMVASKSLARRRSTEPGKGALHHPTPGQDLEARHVVASLDDLQRPLADLFQRLAEFRSGVGAIGEDVAQPGEGPSQPGKGALHHPTPGQDLEAREQRRRAVSIRDSTAAWRAA